MAGVSLAIALFLVLDEKSLLLKCFAVLLHGFFLVTRNRHAEILCVFQGAILRLQGKRPGQNRIMSYEAPPFERRLFCGNSPLTISQGRSVIAPANFSLAGSARRHLEPSGRQKTHTTGPSRFVIADKTSNFSLARCFVWNLSPRWGDSILRMLGKRIATGLTALAMTAFYNCLRLFRRKTVPICHCEGAQRPWQSVSPNFALCILHFAFRASAR